MRGAGIVWLLVGVLLVLLSVWIVRHTYWADAKVPMPLKGEASINPFYAQQRFAEALGARTVRDRVFTTPPASAVVVLSAWHWNLSTGRRKTLERWVESGGRLVADWTMAGGDEFEGWSGIVREYRKANEPSDGAEWDRNDSCREFQEDAGDDGGGADATPYLLCDVPSASFLTTGRNRLWALHDRTGVQAVRVAAGRGTVTVINSSPFRYRNLLEGDHGSLFVAATGLRRGDEVHFLSEENHPSLLALVWQQGGPVVALTFVLIALGLWRGAVRFGPPAPPPPNGRRSLAEQIRGTGYFALRHGGGESLHAAAVRALDDAANRYVAGYAELAAADRAAALARLTGLDRNALATAVHRPAMRRSELCSTIALLETARRRTLAEHTRHQHGTH